MKFNIQILFSFFLLAFLFSCRHDGVPEDIHEHEEIELVTLTLSETGNETNTQQIKYIGGVADKALTLEIGKTYEASLDFFHGDADHFHSMLEEIIEEKDEHFILFSFAGVDSELQRLGSDAVRSDGEKLGIKTIWKVLEKTGAAARVHIQLSHGASSVQSNYPSSIRQFGQTQGGESDVNMQININ